ncbi:MAG TPA: hypothetical protein PLM90_06155, partial [Chitinophagales bacterium]|nr:hypothetical protein [Chitinophagales bacterium]
MKASQSVILGLSVLTILSSCGSNKGSKEYLNDWKFTENIDKAKIVQTDGESGKMFDLLSSKTTGINFNNELIETFDLNYYRYGYSYNGAGVGVGDFNNDG